jgi:hypothetical protein
MDDTCPWMDDTRPWMDDTAANVRRAGDGILT